MHRPRMHRHQNPIRSQFRRDRIDTITCCSEWLVNDSAERKQENTTQNQPAGATLSLRSVAVSPTLQPSPRRAGMRIADGTTEYSHKDAADGRKDTSRCLAQIDREQKERDRDQRIPGEMSRFSRSDHVSGRLCSSPRRIDGASILFHSIGKPTTPAYNGIIWEAETNCARSDASSD